MNPGIMNDVYGRCEAIEECYEFMLAYAVQGLPTDTGSTIDREIRESLQRAANAFVGLADSCRAAVDEEGLEPAARYHAFLAVVDRDARDSLAAFDLVLGQPALGSQLIDNLNASIHVRALLTDLFLIDEIFKGAPDGGRTRRGGIARHATIDTMVRIVITGSADGLGRMAAQRLVACRVRIRASVPAG